MNNWTATNRDTLALFSIYDRPSDYPDGYVVRRWEVVDGRSVPGAARTAPTLERARRLLPPGLINLGRKAGDDPCIVETWI